MSSVVYALVRALAVATLLWNSSSAQNETPEDIFRRTVSSWQRLASNDDWTPWHSFCQNLWLQFGDDATVLKNRLGIVGALEEGILTIEKVVFERGMGENRARDVALSKLYTTYAKTLMSLDSTECLNLALDPHTLLIGAETADKRNPSTHLCIENSENSLRNAASLDATNMQAVELIKEVTGKTGSVHQRKPNEFVAELFDSFADTFDDKLLNTLDYKVPRLVGELAKNLSPKYNAVMDAGCGTGLAGRYLRPLVLDGLIIGVDASQKMLDKAALCTVSSGCGLSIDVDNRGDDRGSPLLDPHRRLYDGLVKIDLEEMTVEGLATATGIQTIRGFDLIVAADVLVYFGSLENLLNQFAQIAVPRSRLIFSCELATQEEAPLGWRLLPTGRFAHTKAHAIESAGKVGYELQYYEEIVPRIEKGEPVKGHLFAFQLEHGGGSRGSAPKKDEL